MNMRKDAESYGWNGITQKAISDGIRLAYKSDYNATNKCQLPRPKGRGLGGDAQRKS